MKEEDVLNVTVEEGVEESVEVRKKYAKGGILVVAGFICIVAVIMFVVQFLDGTNKLKRELSSSIKNLEKIESYGVTSFYGNPDGTESAYAEFTTPTGDRTEAYYDASGSILPYQNLSGNFTTFTSDYITPEGNMYFTDSTEDGLVYYEVPKAYADLTKDRRTMYADILLDGLLEIESVDDETFDIGNGEETFKMYKGIVDGDSIAKIMRIGTYDMYRTLYNENKSDANIAKFMQWNMDEIDFTLNFGDAEVIFGVSNGVLKYVDTVVGGLGTKMSITKCIITDNIANTDLPDFTDAKAFVEVFRETADFCEPYNSMEEAQAAMYNQYYNGTDLESTDVLTDTTSEEEIEDDNADVLVEEEPADTEEVDTEEPTE